MTYRELARIFSVSPNTVKTRINRMLKQGVIVNFFVCVSRAVLGSEYVAGFVYTDGSENMIELMKQIAGHPAVGEIYRTSDRRYEYFAHVLGARETFELNRFLGNLNVVTDVEIRPVVFHLPNCPSNYHLNSRGKRVTFSREQLRVLRCLITDARLPVSQIAQQTGFTPRRVRKILQELQEGGGVNFTVDYNLYALGDMEYRLRICFDEGTTTGQDIIMWVYERYPDEFFWGSITTNEPIVDVGMIIDCPGRAHPIMNEVKAAAFTQSVEDFVSYPHVVPWYNRLRARLLELLDEAGL